MSALPGAVVIPKTYGQEVVVFSAAFGWEGVVDGAPVRQQGRLFKIKPGKAQRVPFEVWRFIQAHYPFSDVVRVNEVESETGIQFDLKAAKTESLAKGEAADLAAFKAFVSAAVEDFVKHNKPVPQPSDNVLAIIERRGYDLKKFGIVPIGWEEPEKDKTIAELKEQLAKMQEQINAATKGK